MLLNAPTFGKLGVAGRTKLASVLPITKGCRMPLIIGTVFFTNVSSSHWFRLRYKTKSWIFKN